MGMVNIFYSCVFVLRLISMSPMTGTLFLLLKYSRARKDPPIAAAWFRRLYLEYLSNILAVPTDIRDLTIYRTATRRQRLKTKSKLKINE